MKKLNIFFLTTLLLTGLNIQNEQTADAKIKTKSKTYVVKKGDNLFRIAKNHGMTLSNLKKINHLNSNLIKPGQKLKLNAKPKVISKRKAKEYRIYNISPLARKANWKNLAACESNNTPDINTGNGYFGAYQFDMRTWQAVGGKGLPSDASLKEQTKRAMILYTMRGNQPWPVCGRNL